MVVPKSTSPERTCQRLGGGAWSQVWRASEKRTGHHAGDSQEGGLVEVLQLDVVVVVVDSPAQIRSAGATRANEERLAQGLVACRGASVATQ
jgi:hypothetical protein